ncbi:hypothetical protein [Pseudomonas lundensis]|uniref:hypothetical protein n=1 Tax=Pseudomonas lundensis TaxID=86185 RepID=UPI0030B9F66B
MTEISGVPAYIPIQALACVTQGNHGLATAVEKYREWPAQVVRFVDNDVGELQAYDRLVKKGHVLDSVITAKRELKALIGRFYGLVPQPLGIPYQHQAIYDFEGKPFGDVLL